jgi:hypothetical protein
MLETMADCIVKLKMETFREKGRGRMWMSRGEEMIRRKAGQDCEMGEDDIVSLLDSFCPRSLGKLNRASNHILSWAIIHGSTRQKVPKIEIRK